MDYCVTDLDEEPTAKNVFINKYSYVVNKNKISWFIELLVCLAGLSKILLGLQYKILVIIYF